MTRTAYTLEIPREALTVSMKHSPAAVLVSAVIYALAVSISDSVPALFIASILPVTLLATKSFPISRLVSVTSLTS